MHNNIRPVLLCILLAGGTGVTQAAPIAFTNSTYTTFAEAVAGTDTDGPDSASTMNMLPITSAADVTGAGGETASAVAFADTLFLTTTTEARGGEGAAAASSAATFRGLFNAAPGLLDFSFNLDSFADQLANGFASQSLAVTLEVGGMTLLNEVLFDSALFTQQFMLASGGAGLLDLTLIGTSDASPGDYAFGLASVNFALDAVAAGVPEPTGTALMLAGLLGLGFTRRRLQAKA